MRWIRGVAEPRGGGVEIVKVVDCGGDWLKSTAARRFSAAAGESLDAQRARRMLPLERGDEASRPPRARAFGVLPSLAISKPSDNGLQFADAVSGTANVMRASPRAVRLRRQE